MGEGGWGGLVGTYLVGIGGGDYPHALRVALVLNGEVGRREGS